MPAKKTHNRNTVLVPLSLLPAELAELDALAARLARPGHRANRSDAARELLRAVLNAEAAGLLDIEDGRIWLRK
jgi:hypothetical protein